MKTDGGHTLRLVVSWYEGYQACDDFGSPNKVTVDGGNDDVLTLAILICAVDNEGGEEPKILVEEEPQRVVR